MDGGPQRAGLMRLPFRAAAFVVLVCVAILGMSGLREWNLRAATLQAAKVELANLARSLIQHAEDSFDLLDASILGAVGRIETDGATPATLAKLQDIFVARKAASERISGFAIVDENGDWLASSGATGKSLGDREFFRHHLQSTDRDAFIGRPVKSLSGEWVMTVSRRFNHRDGSFGGVVIATIGAPYFSEFYGQFDIGASGTVSLLSTKGIALARRPDDGNVGRDLSDGPFFKAIRSDAFSDAYYFRSNLDGLQRLGVYQQTSRYPLMVLVTKAQDEVLAPWRHAAITRMIFVLGLIMLIAVMGLYLVRQLLQGRRLAVALAAKEANFRVLAEGSSDMVTRVGLDEQIHYASPSSIRIVGWRPDQLVGTPALAGVNPEDLVRVEEAVAALKHGDTEEARIAYRTRHREKSEIWVESTLRVTRTVTGKVDGVVAITRDVSQQKKLEGKLETLAIEDGLTGLANRRRFDERLLEEWGRAQRENTPLAMLILDLDHFKMFNDEYGHPAGDECLRAIAGILRMEAKRTADLAARYGGEEFAMLLPNTDAKGCARIAEKILREIRRAGMAHRLNLPSGRVTASIGGAVFRTGADRSAGHASLIEAADRALYSAKRGGRDRLVMAAPSVRQLFFRSAAG
jgi:diguanylate cyclase (GGDEF)-like protein/PAS domain S-box-containing protein